MTIGTGLGVSFEDRQAGPTLAEQITEGLKSAALRKKLLEKAYEQALSPLTNPEEWGRMLSVLGMSGVSMEQFCSAYGQATAKSQADELPTTEAQLWGKVVEQGGPTIYAGADAVRSVGIGASSIGGGQKGKE